jgi:hypothetical protein
VFWNADMMKTNFEILVTPNFVSIPLLLVSVVPGYNSKYFIAEFVFMSQMYICSICVYIWTLFIT